VLLPLKHGGSRIFTKRHAWFSDRNSSQVQILHGGCRTETFCQPGRTRQLLRAQAVKALWRVAGVVGDGFDRAIA
jgi:hypothetical protein